MDEGALGTVSGIVGDVCALSCNIPIPIPFLCNVSPALPLIISLPMPFAFMRAEPSAGMMSADFALICKEALLHDVFVPRLSHRGPPAPLGSMT